MEWIICSFASAFVNVFYLIKIIIKEDKIRGLENQVKMRDERIEKLLSNLSKFDKV